MSQFNSARTNGKASTKPKKPYSDFPLTPHANGFWQKKIRGKIHYFGKWARRVDGKLVRVEGDGWEAALAEYKRVADDLHVGRTPRTKTDGLTVAALCNHYLTAKLRKVEAGELTSALFYDYRVITDFVVKQFGTNRLVEDLAANDFAELRAAMAGKWGPVRLANSITRAKSVFKYGYESGLMAQPVRYGPEFQKPSASALRRHRANQPARVLEPTDIHALIGSADVPMKAMILLGVNCGFGNADCADLPIRAVNLETGWVDFPRPKTGIARRCSLWPETVSAIRVALEVRSQPAVPSAANRVFLSEAGTPLVSQSARGNTKDLVGYRFTNLLKALKLYRKQIGFYTLRHVFETVAGGSKDQVAVDLVMGHLDGSMAANYRERIDDARLRAVADHVRAWLFGPSA